MIYIFYVPQLRTGKLDLPYCTRQEGGRRRRKDDTYSYVLPRYVVRTVRRSSGENQHPSPFTGSFTVTSKANGALEEVTTRLIHPNNGEACSVRCVGVDNRAVSFQFSVEARQYDRISSALLLAVSDMDEHGNKRTK